MFAPSRTLASAAVFAAASQPSTSSDASASAMPRACISASASSNRWPCSIAVRMKFVVLLTTPRKPRMRTAGQRLAHQVEDRHAVHHRAFEQEAAVRRAPPRAPARGRRTPTGPLFAVMTCAPPASAARMWLDRRLAALDVERRRLDDDEAAAACAAAALRFSASRRNGERRLVVSGFSRTRSAPTSASPAEAGPARAAVGACR